MPLEYAMLILELSDHRADRLLIGRSVLLGLGVAASFVYLELVFVIDSLQS